MTSRTSSICIGMIKMGNHSRHHPLSRSLPLFTIIEITEDSGIDRSNSRSSYDIVMEALHILIASTPPAATLITDDEGDTSDDDDNTTDNAKGDDSQTKVIEEIKRRQRRLRSVSRWDAESTSNNRRRNIDSSRGVNDCIVDRPPTRPVRRREIF
jgi:hypothetical protein